MAMYWDFEIQMTACLQQRHSYPKQAEAKTQASRDSNMQMPWYFKVELFRTRAQQYCVFLVPVLYMHAFLDPHSAARIHAGPKRWRLSDTPRSGCSLSRLVSTTQHVSAECAILWEAENTFQKH